MERFRLDQYQGRCVSGNQSFSVTRRNRTENTSRVAPGARAASLAHLVFRVVLHRDLLVALQDVMLQLVRGGAGHRLHAVHCSHLLDRLCNLHKANTNANANDDDDNRHNANTVW